MSKKPISPRERFDCSIQLVSIESHRRLNCKPQEITETHNVKCILLKWVYILFTTVLKKRSFKTVQFVECSNGLSSDFAVRHLDVALPSVLHHICSIKNSFDLRCESFTYVYEDTQ